MINFSDFLKTNLIEGFKSGTFNKVQVNIFSFNYLSRGLLKQEHFTEIQEVLYPKEEEE